MSRCSNKFIAYMPDGATSIDTNPIYTNGITPNPIPQITSVFSHDYLIARRCFFFDLMPFDGAPPCDEQTQPVGMDASVFRAILLRRYEMADGAFGQFIGFAPWHLKYSNWNGGFNKYEPIDLEWAVAQLVTAYNLAKEADAAHPCWVSNASAYYKSPIRENYAGNKLPAAAKVFDPNTVYILMYLGDYDSSAWMKAQVPRMWQDPYKDSAPNAWAFDPNLIERIPMAFDYVYENLGPTDYFVAGDAGAGYVVPYNLFESGMRPRADATQKWMEYNRPYLSRMGLDICGFITNGGQLIDKKIMALYSKMFPAGNLHSEGNGSLEVYDGVAFVHFSDGLAASVIEDPDRLAKVMYVHIKTGMRKYNFAAFGTVCITPTDNKAIREAFLAFAKKTDLRTTYEFVDPYTFFDLIRQSGQGVRVPLD